MFNTYVELLSEMAVQDCTNALKCPFQPFIGEVLTIFPLDYPHRSKLSLEWLCGDTFGVSSCAYIPYINRSTYLLLTRVMTYYPPGCHFSKG